MKKKSTDTIRICAGRLFQTFAVLALFVLFSCGPETVEELEKELLFSLEIGKMDDQIELFQFEDDAFHQRNHLVMRDGIVYIANGNANKIMEFTSYGDLLSLFYNPEQNPQPVLLSTENPEGRVVNKRAYPFPFVGLRHIAVTDDRVLLVEDQLPKERYLYDEELDAALNRIIRRFTSKGKELGTVGQEGVGGTPFPYVEELYVTNDNDIVVVCRTIEKWITFWYSGAGDLRYRVVIDSDRLPVAREGDIPNLEMVCPDLNDHRLYLKLDYYREEVDPSTGAQFGIENAGSRIYWLNLKNGKYEGFINIPENKQRATSEGQLKSEEIEYYYQLIGISRHGHFFLLSREAHERNRLVIMDAEGKVIRRRYVTITERSEEQGLLSLEFFLSPDGILSALLLREDRADVVWWRTDKQTGAR
jgi:hypothetical protein